MAQPPSSPFWAIGDFDVRLEGRIVMVRSTSTFNYECVREYAKALAQLIPKLPATFSLYSEFDAPPVMAQDVEALMTAITRDAVRYGLRAVALVCTDATGRGVAQVQWARMYATFGVPHGFFDGRAEALDWLEQTVG